MRDYARMLTCHGRDDEAKRRFLRAIKLDEEDKYTKRAYDEFLEDINSDSRDPDECLCAAVEKDPNYVEGIACAEDRRIRKK